MKIPEAVSVVLVQGDRVFAVQRQNNLRAFPGYWAFPGGKVDAGDEALVLSHAHTRGHDPRLLGAAFREVKEEIALDLAAELAAGNVESIVGLGLALTPSFNPQRFATTFFKVTLKHEPAGVHVDQSEAQRGGWYPCRDLLDSYRAGDLLAVPPTVAVLEALGADISVTSIPRLAFQYDETREVPVIQSQWGLRQIMPLSHTLPPAERTNSFLIGDEGARKLLLDPSPRDEAELEKFLRVVDRWGMDAIMLSHHHGDHHEYAPKIARDRKLPLLMSADTRMRLLKQDAHYFDGCVVEELKHGDVVTRWLGHEVLVHAVPGHDEGQMALHPRNLAWFIAGDLFQGVGTVVIGGDEGDMAKYMRTLEGVIALKPKVIYPSHGIGLGGTLVLEKTLEHRRLREQQVKELTASGKGPEDILALLYSDVPKALWPYALANIHSHLKKIRLESHEKGAQ